MLCRVGDVEIWRILELNAPFRTPEELFPNAGPDVTALLEAACPGAICQKSGRLILPVQGFLLRTPQHLILVDAGVGLNKSVDFHPGWHMLSETRFMPSMAAAGADVTDVDYVLCTHLHVDHVGWNTQRVDGRWQPTFPNAKYLFPADDRAMHVKHDTDMYRESVLPVVETGQADFVDASFALDDVLKLLPTPGHTPGHVSVEITSNGQEALITADAIHSTAQCRYPEWHFAYDFSPDQAVKSRRALLERAAERQQKVLGMHFQLPSVGRVSVHGDAFLWHAD